MCIVIFVIDILYYCFLVQKSKMFPGVLIIHNTIQYVTVPE